MGTIEIVCVCVLMCTIIVLTLETTCPCVEELRGQLQMCSFLSSCGLQKLNSGCLAISQPQSKMYFYTFVRRN